MFKELTDRIAKTNDQRIKMICTLANVMENEHVGMMELKASVATSMLEMLSTSMIEEDTILIKMLNKSIDKVCSDIESETGLKDVRERFEMIIEQSREKIQRLETAESILKNINFN